MIFVTPTRIPTLRPPPTPGASSYYNKGKDYFDDGKYKLAVNEFTTAIQLNPIYTNAHSMRGTTYHNLGQYRRTIENYDKVI